jgi:hypothetical protein
MKNYKLNITPLEAEAFNLVILDYFINIYKKNEYVLTSENILQNCIKKSLLNEASNISQRFNVYAHSTKKMCKTQFNMWNTTCIYFYLTSYPIDATDVFIYNLINNLLFQLDPQL